RPRQAQAWKWKLPAEARSASKRLLQVRWCAQEQKSWCAASGRGEAARVCVVDFAPAPRCREAGSERSAKSRIDVYTLGARFSESLSASAMMHKWIFHGPLPTGPFQEPDSGLNS